MADSKLTSLTALVGTQVEQTADVLPIVDNSATQTKKILVSEMSSALCVIGTPVATTSGTQVTIASGIPSWAKRIIICLAGVSTSGTNYLTLSPSSIGGGISGASGTRSAEISNVFFFPITQVNIAARSYSGAVTFTKEKLSAETWAMRGIIAQDSGAAGIHYSAGRTVSGQQLSSIFLGTNGGVDTFDAGEVNIQYE